MAKAKGAALFFGGVVLSLLGVAVIDRVSGGMFTGLLDKVRASAPAVAS